MRNTILAIAALAFSLAASAQKVNDADEVLLRQWITFQRRGGAAPSIAPPGQRSR